MSINPIKAMKQNMNTADKFVRMTLGAAFLVLLLTDSGDRGMQWVATCCGLYLILTSLAGSCVVYHFLDISTLSSGKRDNFY